MDSVSALLMLAMSLPSRYVIYTTHTFTTEVYFAWYVKCVTGCRGIVGMDIRGRWGRPPGLKVTANNLNKQRERMRIVQIDVTRFIISQFTAQHVSNVSTSIFRSSRLTVDLFHVLYFSGSMCVGVTVWFGWGGVVSLCRLNQCFNLLYYFTIYCSTCFEC